MPRHLIPYLIPIILALGCQGVIDGGDDEAIADTPDGTFNLDIAYPDARVYMYGEPGSPFGEFSTIDGVVTYPLEEEYEWLPFAHSSPPLPAYPSNTLPFPYPRGVPDLDLDSPAYADRWWENYEMTRDGMMVPYDIPATAQPRSWLVAAYGFYVPTPSNSAALAVLCERDRECESSYVDTPLDVLLAAYVEQRLLEWETVTLWVHRGDMVLPTYLRLRPAQL